MKWHDIFRKANEYEKQAVNEKIDEHADQKVLIAQTLQNLQERHAALAQSCAQVVANNKQTEMRLARALAEQTQLTANIQAALANGHEDSAKVFAVQLATVEGTVESLKTLHEQTLAAAEQAKQALADNADEMQAKIAEAQQLKMEVDQAAMSEQMASNMKAVTDTANIATPGFDAIRDRVEGRFALAQASAEAAGTDPSVAAMHAHHEAIQDQADAILARFKAPAAIPETAS